MTAGIWLGQVRQGFNWSDAASLVKQREHIAATVSKYKDHPALLMWALGNEMEDNEGKNGAVWTAINSLAVMVEQLDPNHPTMTVIAEIGGDKVANILIVPAGWMGNTEAMSVEPDWATNPKSGKTAMKCAYSAGDGWGGVVWQSPEGDWGDKGGGYDLSGAKKLSFWARGEKGGEMVNFSFGLIGTPKKFPDTAKGNLEGVALGTEWKQYEIPVEGKDLQRIKTGFSWTVAGNGAPITFYLDDVQWE